MSSLTARDILSMSEEEVWALDARFEPTELVELVMDGGVQFIGQVAVPVPNVTIKANIRYTIISWYLWDIHRHYPKTPILPSHHLSYLKFDGKVFLSILTNIARTVIETYQHESSVKQVSSDLALLIYRTMNRVYNMVVGRLGAYVDTMDARDYINVLKHPTIQALRDECIASPTPKAISNLYNKIPEAVEEEGFLPGNSMVRSMIIRSTPIMQINQIVGVRGSTTDLNSYMFKHPITDSFGTGLRNISDFIQESRSATKALMFQKDPIRATEYFNRRLQILGQFIRHIFPGDCGSEEYLPWKLQVGDLKHLDGKYYLTEEGKLDFINAKSPKVKVGQTIYLRSPTMCKHKHLGGACETCLGRLSLTLPYGTNIGHVSAYVVGEKITQATLSVKHLDKSTEIEDIRLDASDMKYVHLSSKGSENIKFNKIIKELRNPTLIVRVDSIPNLTQAMNVDNLNELSVFKISNLQEVGIMYDYDSDGQILQWVTVSGPSRPSSFTTEFLEYIKEHKYEQWDNKSIRIDLSQWDITKPAMILPAKQINMLDFMKEVATMLECNPKESAKKGLDPSRPEDLVSYLRSLLEYTSQHINLNIMYLEVLTLSLTIENSEFGDYRIAKDSRNREFSSAVNIMHYRSIGPSLAYQEQSKIMYNNQSYNLHNRVNHPMDSLFLQDPNADLYKQWVYKSELNHV